MGAQDGAGDRPAVSLAGLLPAARFIGCDDLRVRSSCDDADRCRRGDLFVARLTRRGDGHEAVPRAIARGACGVVAERIVPTGGLPLCLVPDSAWAGGRVAHALAGDPARALKLIAVTGTSGKTTTAWLAAAVLAEAGLRVGVLSDLGCLDADGTLPQLRDYRSAASLAGRLATLAAGGCTHAVVEVSSRMLAEHALAGVTCDTVVVTNLATAHLAEHGTQRRYHAIKARVLDALPDRGCLVTGDGPAVERLRRLALRRRPALELRTAGAGAGRDVAVRSLDRSLFGRTVLVTAGGQLVPATLATPVTGFARDAALAVAVGLRHGVPLELAVRGLESAGAVPGRVERIDRGQEAAVFLDAATSGHALAATLASLRRLTRGRLALVADERAAATIGGKGFAARVARWCDECLVAPRSMLRESAAGDDLAAYARLDRLLSGLGRRDCLLVLGGPTDRRRGPGPGPDDGESALADIVDGWLRLAHPPRLGRRGSRAA